jgi:hypothetical protein
MMAVAELEAGMISARTKAAVAANRPAESSWDALEVVPAPQQTPPRLVSPEL